MAYDNGRVPEHLLVRDRHGNPWFPGTYRKWVRFQKLVHDRTGVWLAVTPRANGAYNTYRDYAGQERLKEHWTRVGQPNMASDAGYSSHGGLWTGRTNGRYGMPARVYRVPSGAFDVVNVSAVPWSVIEQAASEVGLLCNIVVPKELWHFVDLEPWKTDGGPSTAGGLGSKPLPAPAKPKEIRVKHYHYADRDARAKGRLVQPGAHFYLHTLAGQPASHATNVVGGVGPYSVTVHVYAEGGRPGDVVEVKLVWQDTKAKPIKNSQHYTERLVVDKDGRVQASREFKRDVPAGYAVYARVDAPKTNAGPFVVTVLDSDAYLFTVA